MGGGTVDFFLFAISLKDLWSVHFLTQYSRVGIPFGQNFHGIAILLFSEVIMCSVLFTFMFYIF